MNPLPGRSEPSATRDPELATQVVTSFADAAQYREAWNQVVADTGADIYQTYEWCETWWKFYGAGRDLSLLLIFADSKLVGVVPGFTETLWLGPVRIRGAKLLGADFSLTLCNLAVPPSLLAFATFRAAEHFLGAMRADTLQFGPLAGPTADFDTLRAAAALMPDLVARADLLGNTCNTFFALPASFDAYLKGLDKKQRSNFKRMSEQSAKSHAMAYDTLSSADQVISEFEVFLQQHEVQWRADGKLGHFGDWPHAVAFNRELVRTFAPQGKVRFYRIHADGQTISSQYGFVHGRTVYWRLPARVRSAEWDRFSLGTLGLVKMIEAMLGEGQTVIEGGRGHYAYKVQHGAKEWPLRTVQLRRAGPWVAFRLALFRPLARVLDIVYYKIVFARLAPRIPFLQRALWPVWIRTTG